MSNSTSDDDEELLEISCDAMFWWWWWPNCTAFPRAWWAARCSEIPKDSVKLESGLFRRLSFQMLPTKKSKTPLENIFLPNRVKLMNCQLHSCSLLYSYIDVGPWLKKNMKNNMNRKLNTINGTIVHISPNFMFAPK